MSTREPKAAERERARRLRDALDPEQRTAWSHRAAANLIQTLAFAEAKRLSLFAAIGSEIDALDLERAAIERGVSVLYPKVVGKKLRFCETTRAELVPGPFGLSEPSAEAPPCELSDVSLILVPGLCFDPQSGHRIGYGGGYYDRALADLQTIDETARPLAIGFAFSAQCRAVLEAGPHDIPVDAIVHEEGLITLSARSRARLRPA